MPIESDLVTGIAENPLELERWLILADWLEDHGDPRAELARLRHLLHTEPDHPERDRRLARQLDLLAAGLSPVVPIRCDNPLAMPLALVLPGTFLMGSPQTEKDRDDEELLHEVTLTEPYYLGVHPVTVGEFAAFVKVTGYRTKAETGDGAWGYDGESWRQNRSNTWRTPNFAQTDRHPVVCLSWNDAQAMIKWLNERKPKRGLRYLLPTEAQWEYACRAGTRTAYWWGDDPERLGEHAWFAENSGHATHPVETKRHNPWGFWHLSGHVWEWCQDWWEHYPLSAETNPGGSGSVGSNRVLRGGCWFVEGRQCRSAYRNMGDPGGCSSHLGFRLAAFALAR